MAFLFLRYSFFPNKMNQNYSQNIYVDRVYKKFIILIYLSYSQFKM